jgi:non-specific serine/threonine protein kinase
MATGVMPFQGETSAVVFDAILNKPPKPLSEVNSLLPEELGRIISQALEKDRDLRYQNATDIKIALKRLKRDLDSGRHSGETSSAIHTSRMPSTSAPVHEHSIAVLTSRT